LEHNLRLILKILQHIFETVSSLTPEAILILEKIKINSAFDKAAIEKAR
jgi:hypothetical protein